MTLTFVDKAANPVLKGVVLLLPPTMEKGHLHINEALVSVIDEFLNH